MGLGHRELLFPRKGSGVHETGGTSDQEHLLAQASDNNWTRAQLRGAVTAANAPAGVRGAEADNEPEEPRADNADAEQGKAAAGEEKIHHQDPEEPEGRSEVSTHGGGLEVAQRTPKATIGADGAQVRRDPEVTGIPGAEKSRAGIADIMRDLPTHAEGVAMQIRDARAALEQLISRMRAETLPREWRKGWKQWAAINDDVRAMDELRAGMFAQFHHVDKNGNEEWWASPTDGKAPCPPAPPMTSQIE
jgi:hypothetical protein